MMPYVGGGQNPVMVSGVDLSVGFNLSSELSERIAVLDWIHDEELASPGHAPDLGPLLQKFPLERRQTLMNEIRDLATEGFLHLHSALSFSGTSCQMTASGRQFVGEVRQRRGDTVARRRATRDAFLRWLYETKMNGVATPQLSEFSVSPFGSFFGRAFTDNEIRDAQLWLRDQGLISGQATWGGPIPRPFISDLGETVVESGQSVNDSAALALAAGIGELNIISVSNSSHTQIANHSPGAVQSAELSFDSRQQVVLAAKALLQALPVLGLDSDGQREAERIGRELEDLAAQESPDRGVLEQLLDSAMSIAISGTGKALGSAVVHLAEQAIAALAS